MKPEHRFKLSIFSILLLSLPILSKYIFFQFQTLLALMLIPFAFNLRHPHSYSQRYAFIAYILLILHGLCKIKILYLFGVGTAIFALIENKYGRLNELGLLLLLLLSPTLHYLLTVFTFPIRLQLSSWAGQYLHWIGVHVRVVGNVFERVLPNGQISTFSVDPACMGLNLIHTALTAIGLWIGFAETRLKKYLSLSMLSFIFCLTFALLLITNLLRIVLLVYFKSMPNTWGHEIMGLSCLIVYTLLPIFAVTNFLFRRYGRNFLPAPSPQTFHSPKYWDIGLICLIFGANFYPTSTPISFDLQKLMLPGFQKQVLNEHILKFVNDTALIYIKPPAPFWGADHTPMICWVGSGYVFSKIETKLLEKHEIYTATLQKDTHKLQTAWWYENNQDITIQQTRWRWLMARGGKGYQLVNVTTADTTTLKTQCRQLILNHLHRY